MEMKGSTKIRELIQKIGIPRLVIIVLTGILLLVLSLPVGESSQTETRQEETTAETEEIALDAMHQYAKTQEEETEEILSKVEGIGKVKVMLTISASEEKITLKDSNVQEEDMEETDSTGGSRKEETYESNQESVLVQNDGEESPYVVQVNSPVIEGVVVVAQGLDSSETETEIIEAIQALFSIESHKIKVMKMK